jgi:hypothetical protein
MLLRREVSGPGSFYPLHSETVLFEELAELAATEPIAAIHDLVCPSVFEKFKWAYDFTSVDAVVSKIDKMVAIPTHSRDPPQ